MKKCVLKIIVFAFIFVLGSCKGQSVKVNGNGISLKQNNHTLDELVFDSFELKENKKDGNIIIVDYEFKDDPNEVGLPKFPTYKGELYITVDGEKIKPILNIVHELQQLSGPRIKLLNCSKENNYFNLEYDVQLYEQRPAAFGTVKISYEFTGSETEGYKYTVVDYKSELTSHFKHTDEEDPASMIPSMEGDIIKQVGLSLDEFENIANQVLGIKKTDNLQDENIQANESEDTISQEPDIVENQEDEDLSILNSDENYQTEDPLKSNYRKTYWDGMSWRKRDITYDENNKTIDKEKMMSTIWNLDSSIAYDYILLFYLDDVFQIGDIHSASIFAQGNYKFEDGKLVLYSIVYSKSMNFIASIFEGMEVIVPDLRFESNHFYYDNELIINGTTFYPQGCIKEEGKSAIIDGVNVITERSKKVFTDNVRFRTAPSTTAKTQIVDLYDISTGEKTDILRKGTILNTYARTEYTETIDGIESPWYYIRVDGQYGWVFGAYFTDYIEAEE